jgi:hypothetical protein
VESQGGIQPVWRRTSHVHLRVQDRPVSFAWVSGGMAFTIGELDARVMIDRPMIWDLGLCDPQFKQANAKGAQRNVVN